MTHGAARAAGARAPSWWPARASSLLAGATGDCSLESVELAFGVAGCARADTSYTVAQAGPWMDRPRGGQHPGSLGVLLDHALGEQLYIHCGEGQLSLTTELVFNIIEPPPWRTSTLLAESWATRIDRTGGHAQGLVRDDSGAVIATGSTWVRYASPAARTTAMDPALHPPRHAAAQSLEDHLGFLASAGPDGARAELPHPELWANEYGIVHGGVWAALVEAAAGQLLAAVSGDTLATASVRISYIRPGDTGPLSVDAEPRHIGRSFGEASATGTDFTGQPCVLATVTGRRL